MREPEHSYYKRETGKVLAGTKSSDQAVSKAADKNRGSQVCALAKALEEPKKLPQKILKKVLDKTGNL